MITLNSAVLIMRLLSRDYFVVLAMSPEGQSWSRPF
jgi:hypothetical protein